MAWAFFPLGTEPKPLDIVWCRFPYDEAPAFPAPDPHPCVVKGSFEDQDGNPWLHVVYGTSSPNIGAGFGRYRITGNDIANLGLKKDPTTICLWRIAEVPYAEEFFPLVGGLALPTAYPMRPELARDFATEAAYYDNQNRPQINEEPRKSGEATE